MRLGAMRHRICVERPVSGTPDAFGHQPDAWETLADAYASIEPLSGRDLELARQSQARVTHRVTIRYREGVDVRCRILHRDRALNVRSVLREDEGSRVLNLLCEEAV